MNRTFRHVATAVLAVAVLALTACGNGEDTARHGAADGDPALPSEVQDWALPTLYPGSQSPSLAATPDGRVLLSWVNSQPGRRHIFQFATWSPSLGRWIQAPATIAIGHSMFVNWADVPHMSATADGALWAHWLQRNGDQPNAYDVVLVRSTDGGANWGTPTWVHDDGTRTEHGFVSLWPQSEDTLGVAWLDGRNTAPGHSSTRGHAGAMTLRATVFDARVQKTVESVIDVRVCDCCQTSAAMTASGPVLAWRGRSEDEIRDIRVSRFDGVEWSAPQTVHDDGWRIEGCPVNGPSIDADGHDVAVAWFTMDGDTPVVRLAHSGNAGDGFAAPVELDRGDAVLGRVAVQVDGLNVWVLWLREEADGQSIWLSRRDLTLATEYERIEVARLQGEGRATGFPQLAVQSGVAYVVWTNSVGGAAQLSAKRIVRP